MSLLGALSLVGLMIKNAIVLIEEIDQTIEQRRATPIGAILDSSVALDAPGHDGREHDQPRPHPRCCLDVFFVNMALTMMFGLGFATGTDPDRGTHAVLGVLPGICPPTRFGLS